MTSPTLYEKDPHGKLHLYPHEYQYRALHSEAPVTIVLKGWRGGFTSIAPFWMMDTMRACGPGNAALHYLAITPTVAGAEGGLAGTMRDVICDTLGYGKYTQGRKTKITLNTRGEQFLWGHAQDKRTELHFCAAADPNSFAHYTALAIAMDEINQSEFKHESWNVAKARVSTQVEQISPLDGRPKGRILAGTTVYTLGWLENLWNGYKEAVWNAWKELNAKCDKTRDPAERLRLKLQFKDDLRAGVIHPELNFIRFDSTRNPTVAQKTFDKAREELPAWYFQMRYCARFRRPAGVIYEAWNPAKHVVKKFTIPDSWPRYVAIDFGEKNFHATIWAYDKKRGRHFLYKSYKDSEKDNPDRARDLMALEPKIEWAVAGNRGEGSARASLSIGGIVAVAPPYTDFWTGVTSVGAAIKTDKMFLVDGACPGLEDEIVRYSRPVNEMGEVVYGVLPEKKDTFHWLDTVRYYGTWHFNELLSDSKSETRAGGERLEQKAVEEKVPESVMQIMAGGGTSNRADVYYRERYGASPEKYLDI